LQNSPKAYLDRRSAAPTPPENVSSPSRPRPHLITKLRPAGPSSSASMNKSSTLPLSHRLGATVRDRDRERDGYYSDRNELLREREKERERERGYLSDHNSRWVRPQSHPSSLIRSVAASVRGVPPASGSPAGPSGSGTRTAGGPAVPISGRGRRCPKVTRGRRGTRYHRSGKTAALMTADTRAIERTASNNGEL
jgi:hypothetical protein